MASQLIIFCVLAWSATETLGGKAAAGVVAFTYLVMPWRPK